MIKGRMLFPKIAQYSNDVTYFKSFVVQNKEASTSFSYRMFAKRIMWPHSYLSEIINERKSLSVHRAIEFSRFAKFDVFDTERLIYFSLQKNENKGVKDYFQQKIRSKQENQCHQENDVSKTIFLDMKLLAIFGLLTYMIKYEISYQDASDMLFTFPDLDVDDIENAMFKLEEMNIIKKSGKKFEFLKRSLFAHDELSEIDDISDQIHIKYAENFIRFCQNRKGPGMYSGGFVHLPKNRIDEISDKIYMIRDLIYKFTKEVDQGKDVDLKNYLLFQFDLNLFPIMDKDIFTNLLAKAEESQD